MLSEVYARWTANSYRATDVPYTIYHEGGGTTVTMNQQTNGGAWNLLGTFVMAPGQDHRVEMTDRTSNGTYIIADAVRFVPKAAAKTATWSFTVGTTGTYQVYAKWPASSTHATDAQFTVTHAGGSSTITANQRLNGGTWNLLGTYSFDGGTGYTVDLSDQSASGKVAADAIYVAGTSAPSAAFTWTPTFPSAGAYQVYARWPASSANTAAAHYTVTRDGGTSTATLSQKQNGGAWVLLGSYNFTPSSGQKVELAASSDGTTIADALLFVGAGAQPANLLYVHPDHLGSPQKMTDASQATVWDGVFDPFGEEVAVTGLAAMPIRFPGQYADDETGLNYNYFRDYDATLGRYFQSDPIGLLGGINGYVYVDGSPANAYDPTGQGALKALKYCIKKASGGWRTVTRERAAEELANKGDVKVEGRGKKKKAKKLAKDQFGDKTVHHDAHEDGQMSHYQHKNGGRGHVFYDIAVGLTITHWAEKCNCMNSDVAEVADVFNPLSLANDVREIVLDIAGHPDEEHGE